MRAEKHWKGNGTLTTVRLALTSSWPTVLALCQSLPVWPRCAPSAPRNRRTNFNRSWGRMPPNNTARSASIVLRIPGNLLIWFGPILTSFTGKQLESR